MPDKQQSLILGSIVVALLSTSYIGYINFLCCIGVIIGALVTIWHYTDTHRLTLKPGRGAVLGLQVGVIGAVIALVLNYILIQIGIRHDHLIVDMMIDLFGDNMPREQLDEMIEQRDEPVRLMPYLLQGTLGILISGVFGAIGGAIGSALFKKGEPEAPADTI
jgi:hypothetical protein